MDIDKEKISSIVEKLTEAAKKGGFSPVSSLEDILSVIAENEADLLKELFGGLKSEKCAVNEGVEFEVLKTQRVNKDEESYTHVIYIPKHVWKAFLDMSHHVKRDLGKELLVVSAYRSCAYQASVFLYELRKNSYDWNKTLKYVALPGESEHTDARNTALDFITTEEAVRSKEELDFSQTKEYAWLQKNAANYGFELSYPKGNNKGKAFEPWHWRFIGKADKAQ